MGDVIEEELDQEFEQRLKRFAEKEKARKANDQQSSSESNSQIPAVIAAAL